jgi:hypothetical protein
MAEHYRGSLLAAVYDKLRSSAFRKRPAINATSRIVLYEADFQRANRAPICNPSCDAHKPPAAVQLQFLPIRSSFASEIPKLADGAGTLARFSPTQN